MKSLADVTEKVTQCSNPRGLAEATWPQLVGANPLAQRQNSLALPPIQGSDQHGPKVAQRVALATKQLLIEYSPLDKGEEPRLNTIEAQREMCQLFNGWIDSA